VIDAFREWFGWSRKKTTIFMVVIEFLLGLPSMYSVDYLLYNDLFWGSTMLPIGSIFAMVTFAWILGKGKALSELKKGSKIKLSSGFENFLYYWVKFVLPVFVVLVIIYGWISFFSG